MNQRRNYYWVATKWLGGIALIALIVSLISPSIIQNLDEDTQSQVLVQAIPFFAAFVTILMLYILLIVLLMIRFTGKIPYRIYHPIDVLITVGIIAGVVFLFQPFFFVAFRYGFLVLLVATLLFIVWSHILPRSPKTDLLLPAVSKAATIAGAVAAVLVFSGLFLASAEVNKPVEPYGIRNRLWNSYDDAQKAAIAEQKQAEYSTQILPFLVILNLWPAALVFFSVRGAIDAWQLRNVKTVHGHTINERPEGGGAVVGFTG